MFELNIKFKLYFKNLYCFIFFSVVLFGLLGLTYCLIRVNYIIISSKTANINLTSVYILDYYLVRVGTGQTVTAGVKLEQKFSPGHFCLI